MAKKHTGRKPLHESDPEIIKRLIEALRSGNYIDDACNYAGIAESTYYLWMDRGRQEKARIDAGQPADPTEAAWLDIYSEVQRARSEAVVRNVHLIQAAARGGTWQAAAWWLERTRPDKFGRRLSAEVTGANGGPVEVEVDMITPEALEQRISALLGEPTEAE